MTKLIGSHTQSRWGMSTEGVGVPSSPIPGSWVHVSGKAGEKVVYGIDQIVHKGIDIGIYIQTSGSVQLEYTLSHPELARSREPDMAANVTWTTPYSLSKGPIELSDPPIWSAIRITFTQDADFIIHVV